MITVKPRLKATDINNDIRDAFKRSALLDANKIRVETTGNKVTLHGKVRNYAELRSRTSCLGRSRDAFCGQLAQGGVV